MRPERIPFSLSALAGLILAVQAVYQPVPGPSAVAVSGYAGLQPFRPLTTPIWGALIQALAWAPGVPLAAAAAVLQILIGMGVIYWLARILTDLPYYELKQDPDRRLARDDALRAVAAVVACLYLTASTAFQAAFLFPQPDGIGLLLLLIAWHSFQEFYTSDRLNALYRCAALLAFGAVESPTVALAALPFAAMGMIMLIVRRKFVLRVLVRLMACTLVGVAALVAAVTLYYTSPVAEWREVSQWKDAFDLFLREYMTAGPRAIPRQGWFVILLFALLPIPFVFSRRFQQREEEAAEIGMNALRFFVLPAIAVVALFELPAAPMRVTGSEFALLTPYAAIALWFGRLAGIAFAWVQYPPRPLGAARGASPELRPAAMITLIALAGAIGVAWWRNRPVVQSTHARALARLVEEAVAAAPPGGWIIIDGVLDAALQIRARDEQRTAKTLNLGALGSIAYQRFLHHRMDFWDPAMIAAVGMEAVLADHIKREIDAGRPPIGLMQYELSLPDGWRWKSEGFMVRAVPAAPAEIASLEKALSALKAYASLPFLRKTLSLGLHRQSEWLAAVGARWSNDIGVDAFALGELDLAKDAFLHTLAIEPNHIAALINLRETRAAGGEPLDERSAQLIQRLWAQLPPGAAARVVQTRYGRVVSPNAARARAVEWAAYGFTERALETARSGEETDAAPDARVRMLRAQVLAMGGDTARASSELEAAAAEQPDALAPKLGLLRVRVAEGRLDEARALLAELQRLGLSDLDADIERARIALAEGRMDEVLNLLRAPMKRKPLHPEVALLRAVALQTAGRESEWREALADLEVATVNDPRGLLYLAELAHKNRDRAAAIRYLERVQVVQPGARMAPAALLEMAMQEGIPEVIEQRARALLNIDSNDALAWYGVGVAMARRGKWALAADAFEKSNRQDPSFRTLNDWAWSLHELGQSDAALARIAEACALRPEDPFLWSTRGKIAMDAGRYDLAAESFERALTLGRPDTRILTALLQIYRELNDEGGVARMRAELDARAAMMTPAEVRQLQDLRIR